MQELFDAIKNRRSIRKYQSKPIPQNLIEEILVAANWAPSAHNAQPWRFIILTTPQLRGRCLKIWLNRGLPTCQKTE